MNRSEKHAIKWIKDENAFNSETTGSVFKKLLVYCNVCNEH